MNSKAVKFLSGLFIAYGLYRAYRWIMNGDVECDLKDEIDSNFEDESCANTAISEGDKLMDDNITIESLLNEDSLYNNLNYNEIRGIFFEFYRRARTIKKGSILMKALCLDDFVDILLQVDISDESIVRTMFRVWDYDKDGYVSIRDFMHTFVYAKRGSESDRLSYIFESVNLQNDGVLSFEEVKRNVYYILKADPLVEPESLEELTIAHTRNVFEELHADMTRGITKNNFLSQGRFLREEISLMRIFGLALMEGDISPPSTPD